MFSIFQFFSLFSLFTNENLWIQYQKEYNKSYSLEEYENKFNNFKINLEKITSHNSKSSNYTLGINQFSDLSEKEFKDKYIGGYKYNNLTVKSSSCSKFGSSGKTIPVSIDWIKYSTPVKDQGYCGSCWAFSAVETIESAWAIKKGQLLTLSEQQLVDCSKKYGNMGCNGGLMDNAFHYVIDNGICSESSYPYTSGKSGQDGSCMKTCNSVASLISCSDVTPKNQIALAEAVSQNPVSIAIQADSSIFQSYQSGIITSPTCGTTLDHGVVITGYGIENSIPYWKVRNSWSSSWGEAGFVRILRSSSTNDIGICGVAAQPSFPIV